MQLLLRAVVRTARSAPTYQAREERTSSASRALGRLGDLAPRCVRNWSGLPLDQGAVVGKVWSDGGAVPIAIGL